VFVNIHFRKKFPLFYFVATGYFEISSDIKMNNQRIAEKKSMPEFDMNFNTELID